MKVMKRPLSQEVTPGITCQQLRMLLERKVAITTQKNSFPRQKRAYECLH